MIREMIYVLDDLLEVKYRCKRQEREAILKYLFQKNKSFRRKEINHLDCFVLDNTLFCLSRKNGIQVKKLILWNSKNNEEYCVDGKEFASTRHQDA